MAVQDGDERLQFAGTEPCFESLDRLRRERNFRHEHNRALALFERVGKDVYKRQLFMRALALWLMKLAK